MTTKFVMVDFAGNWADECDFYGFKVMKRSEWDNHVKAIKALPDTKEIRIGYGTNEDEHYTKEGYLELFNVKDVADEEIVILQRLFGKGYSPSRPVSEYGNFHMFENWDDDNMPEQDEDEDEEDYPDDEPYGEGEDGE